MLRVGLTGDLGSGKSTVARLFAANGAIVLSSDEMGRAMMLPGQPVYAAIAAHFGHRVVMPDGALDRRELSRLAFKDGRVAELNAIVHPAVIAEQARLIGDLARTEPHAIVIVESALIFSAHISSGPDHGHAWRDRFDRIVLVTAPDASKVTRFVERAIEAMGGGPVGGAESLALTEEAQRRLTVQASTTAHESECLVIRNDGNLLTLKQKVDAAWTELLLLEPSAPQKR